MFLLLLIDENVVENILGVCDSGAVSSLRRCYLCNTPGHLQWQCPRAAQAGVRQVAVETGITADSTDHMTIDEVIPAASACDGPRCC